MYVSPARQQFLADIYSTALEGGIQYWCVTLRRTNSSPVGDSTWPLVAIAPDGKDGSNWEPKTLTRNDIARAVRMIRDDRDNVLVNKATRTVLLEANRENDASNIDASIADSIVQIAAFGEVVYG